MTTRSPEYDEVEQQQEPIADFEMQLVGVGGEPVRYTSASGIREFFRDVAQSWESFRFEATDLR